jgi:hypothetical protein
VVSHIWRENAAPDIGHPEFVVWNTQRLWHGKSWAVLGWFGLWFPTSGAKMLRQIWGTQSLLSTREFPK